MSAIDDALDAGRALRPRDGLAAEPARRLAVVTCMDARLDPRPDLGLDLGDAHVIRNAGGRVTDDVLRSLVLSWNTLGTREVLVVQHTRCGARTDDEAALRRRIAERAGTDRAAEALAGLDLHLFADHEHALRADLELIRRSPLAPADLVVRGAIHDLERGRLRPLAR